mgnify:CR=1 FL=1
MSVVKSLSEEQVAQIQGWADEGAGLSEIQRRLDSEMDVKVTYMEVRFLIDDLKIQLKPDEPETPEVEAEEEESVDTAAEAEADSEDVADGEPELLGGGKVSVTISELQRPGALVSGRVTFANGKGADWWMDQMGRLGMNADDADYRPTESDMMGFQQELQRVAKEKGF